MYSLYSCFLTLFTKVKNVLNMFLLCGLYQQCYTKVSDSDTNFIVRVNLNTNISHLEHFWKSTGFCPPLPHNASVSDWFLSEDMTQNLIYMGAIPNQEIAYVRIHYLLSAVTISSFDRNDLPIYNFTHLDQLINNLWSNGLRPGFELMGNPGGYFNDFENTTQVILWKDFVKTTAQRYIELYGLGYVQTWHFESWNEPSHHAFDAPINMTIPGLCNYYDACDEGLLEADPSLKLGAPGGELKGAYSTSIYSWALLDHIAHGINFFTQKKGSRVDFISIHKKGEEPDNTKTLFDKEIFTLTELYNYLPELNHIPIYNDEGDIKVTWSADKWWRQDATYAAAIVKVIINHQKQWISQPKGNPWNSMYALLSNDNGFLSYNPHFFSQRTLLARFQMNNTKPHHVQMIRKPAYTVMGLLSLLGDMQVLTTVTPDMSLSYPDFDVLSSVHQPVSYNKQDSWQLAVLLYYSRDTHPNQGEARVNVTIKRQSNASALTDVMYAVYRLDNEHGNPYRVWQSSRSPDTPSWQVLKDMRSSEEPVRVLLSHLDMQSLSPLVLPVTVALPGVTLIHICAKPIRAPDQVPSLSLHHITAGQVLIYWDDTCVHAKCLKTYEVEYSADGNRFVRINPVDSFFNSHVFAPNPSNVKPGTSHDVLVSGSYRVRAVDFWGRAGPYSPIATYSR